MTFKLTRISYPVCWDERMLIYRSSLKCILCLVGSDPLVVMEILVLTTIATGREIWMCVFSLFCLCYLCSLTSGYFKEQSPLTWSHLVFLQTNLKVTSDLLQDGEGCRMPMMDLTYLQRSSLNWDLETFFWTLKTGSTKEHWGLLRYVWIVEYLGARWCRWVCNWNENSCMLWVVLKA